MSLEILLVPLAVAAASAVVARKGGGQRTSVVQTRMRNVDLVAAALADTGATVTRTDGLVEAIWDGMACRFSRTEGDVWAAHFDASVDLAQAEACIHELDKAYGRRVQQHVLETLRVRAAEASFSIVSETQDEDASIVLVVDVGRAG